MLRLAMLVITLGAISMCKANDDLIRADVLQRTLALCATSTQHRLDGKQIIAKEVILDSLDRVIATGVVIRVSGMSVYVEPASGRIRRLDAFRLITETNAECKTVVLDEPVAETLARDHLARLKCPLRSSARPFMVRRSESSYEVRWSFCWVREINGYPFGEEDVTIVFAERCGSLRYFRDYRTTNTCPTAPLIKEEKARGIAKTWSQNIIGKSVIGRDYDVSSVSNGQLRVVYTNRQYLDGCGPSFIRQRRGVRLVYWFDIPFNYIGRSQHHIAVPPATLWVDAITGDSVGGW